MNWFRIAFSLLLVLWAAVGPSQARELADMNGEEIKILQQRLTDAGCYAGAIDGQTSNALQAAKKVCPDQEPILRIETGMHVAPIWRIGVDAQCRLLATGSDDKTVRLWSLPDGRLLRVLRPPIGAGISGKIDAVAMSPDGRYVAVGGRDAHADVDQKIAVSIFDASSGALVARVGAFESIVENLVFSGDGRWIAATLGGGWGLRVIDATNWRVVATDKPYGDESDGAAFAPDGRLYTVSEDGKIRRYGPGPQFRREAVTATRGGRLAFSIAIDPAGQRIAVGFGDTTAVDLYDAPSLTFHAAADNAGIDHGNLSEVAWRADGKVLIAGGTYDIPDAKRPFLIFDRDGRRLRPRRRRGPGAPVAARRRR